jgi:hypothetical protein
MAEEEGFDSAQYEGGSCWHNPIILAFLANVCFSAAYLVDIPLQITFVTWRKYRWALLLTGTLFAILVENYWIADEIYPFVPQ